MNSYAKQELCAEMSDTMFDLSASTPYRWERFEIHGSEATLRWDETGYRLWRIVTGKEPEPVEIPDEFGLTPRDGDPALVAPYFDDAVAVQSALDAARASSAAGARVRVCPPTPAPR